MRIDFNLQKTQEYTGSGAILPPGRYVVAVTREQDVATRDQQGSRLYLTYLVLEGEFKGQTFGENINYRNNNQTAVDIARQRLKSLGLACGKETWEDTRELHNIPFVATTILTEFNGNQVTEIKSYEPRSPQSQVTQTPSLNAVPPQTPQPQAYAAPQYPPQPAQNYAPPQQPPQQYQQPPQAAATDAPFWGN